MSRNRISIAIAALGGQGGGVLSNWIVELAEANGYLAQYTAIAGVAQRTGATIYAIELYPAEQVQGKEPVLALMPVSGDVDVVIASELMEAGRAVNRGIVTPDKTTLITSDHRVYAIGEKEQPGDGRFDADTVREAVKEAAKELIIFDMNALVQQSSSVISSVLFGALAGSGALPFDRDQFEETIKASGRAVDSNLAGFALGFDSAKAGISDQSIQSDDESTILSSELMDRVGKLPAVAQPIAIYGLHRLVDYQDADYAKLYLDRLEQIDDTSGELITEVARFLALWMGYEDVIRVADLKTRAARTLQIAKEVKAADGQVWYGHDYFHPRFEEFTDILPEKLGAAMSGSKFCRKLFSPFFSKGRIIRPKTILGYLLLRTVANLRFLRRRSFKFSCEEKRILAWLDLVKKHKGEVALEIAKCPRLIKGYGDTHTRSINRFSRIMAFVESNGGDADLASKIRELRTAALADDNGHALNSSFKKFSITERNADDGKTREFEWAGSS